MMLVSYNHEKDEVAVEKLNCKMLQARGSHALIYSNSAFYALGGAQVNGEPIRTCEVLRIPDPSVNLNDLCWEQLPSMQKGRSNFGAVAT